MSNTSRPEGNRSLAGRVPPHDLVAEQNLLGAMMLSKDAISATASTLRPDDFYKPAHAHVFEAICSLDAAGEPADPVTVADELSRAGVLEAIGGRGLLADIVSIAPAVTNAPRYARIVSDHAVLRKLIAVGGDIAEIGYELPDDVEKAVDSAESLVYELGQRRVTDSMVPIESLLGDTLDRLEALVERGDAITGLPTGFVDLDRLLSGLQPNTLNIVGARPAMGKTSFALNLTANASFQSRRPVLFFSLEMGNIELTQRLLCAEAQIDSTKVRDGRLQDAEWDRIALAVSRLAEARLFLDDNPNTSVMEIRAKARRLKSQLGDLGLVVIDYLQLMQGRGRSESRQVEVSEMSRGLKILARELECPVIALSQLSRTLESRTDKRPMLADLRESGCLTRGMRLFRADTGLPVTFGELLDTGARDVPVWAVDDGGRIVAAPLTHAFPSGTREAFRVTLRSGAVIEATANHPFRTLGGWTPLGELTVGDRVATGRSLPAPTAPVPMDPDELVVLAHLLGEGTTVARQPLHYTSADEANLAAVEAAALRRFGITARRRPDGRSARTTQLYLPSPTRLGRSRRNPIAEWLCGLGCWDRRAWEKRLPAALFALPDDQVRFFLHHLFATDGSVTMREPGGNRSPAVRVYYATTSAELAQDLRLLLLRVGIQARVRSVRSADHRTGWTIDVSGAAQQRRFLTEVGFHGERGDRIPAVLAALDGVDGSPNVDTVPRAVWDDVRARRAEVGLSERAFQAAIGTTYCGTTLYKSGLSRQRLATVADVLDDEVLAALADSDLFWDEIVAVESIGDQPVYDATVEGVHNFLCEGLVLHNSIEQDADVVMFLYRDEVYNPDSPDRGMAEVIVAKHRNGPTGKVNLAFRNHLTRFDNMAQL